MGVLFTTQPGSGMFNPLVPFAHAFTRAGHTVAFASADCFRPDIEAVGFTAFPAGLDWRADTITHAFPDIPPPGPQRSRWADPHWHRPILGGLIIEFEPAA